LRRGLRVDAVLDPLQPAIEEAHVERVEVVLVLRPKVDLPRLGAWRAGVALGPHQELRAFAGRGRAALGPGELEVAHGPDLEDVVPPADVERRDLDVFITG